MWGQEDQWHPAQPRENHLGDCFLGNSGQWQKKNRKQNYPKNILQRSKFPILKKSMRCLDSVGEVGTQTRDPSPTFLSFIWHTSCQMRPVSDVMRQNREALSDVRPALCSDHCGRRFWFRPKATFYPCVIAFQNTPSYLRPWSSMALDKTKIYMNDKHFMPFKIFLFFVQCKRA